MHVSYMYMHVSYMYMHVSYMYMHVSYMHVSYMYMHVSCMYVHVCMLNIGASASRPGPLGSVSVPQSLGTSRIGYVCLMSHTWALCVCDLH